MVRHGGLAIKNATGFNLTGTVAGSRGLFAVILELNLRLVPRPGQRVVRRYRATSASDVWLAAETLRSAWRERAQGATPNVYPAAIEVCAPLSGGPAELQVETETAAASDAGWPAVSTLDAGLLPADEGGPWPRFDPTPYRSTVRVAVEPSKLKQTVDALQARRGGDAPGGLMVAEVTGGALEIYVDSAGEAAICADGIEDRQHLESESAANGRPAFFRRLKAAFDPFDLLRANVSSGSNGLSP